jgi:hypothetical protein
MESIMDKKDIPRYIFDGIKGNFSFYFCPTSWVEESVFNKRKETCSKCSYIKNYNEDFYKTSCGICGCNLTKKLTLKRSKCPKNFF